MRNVINLEGNTNQNHSELSPLYLSGCLLSIRKVTNAGNCGEKGILLLSGGNVNCTVFMGNCAAISQKIKNTIWSSNTTSGYT